MKKLYISKLLSDNTIKVTYFNEDEPYTRLFIRYNGGYIFECLDNGDRRQVCNGLYHTGDTLNCSEEQFMNTVRKELRKWKKDLNLSDLF